VRRPFLNWVERFVKLETVDTPKPDSNISDVSSDANLPAETLEGQLAAIAAERDRLAAEKADLADRLLRARAEFDNARRRAERERSEFLQFAAMDLVKEVLPVLDDFERALKVETADRNYAKGVELIYQRLSETLKKLGLEPIESAGRMFDPNLHQAVERVETDEAEDHTVIGEFQKGYNFKGKLLRPAMVRVAVRP
jgi:molecular chaperone GrpE